MLKNLCKYYIYVFHNFPKTSMNFCVEFIVFVSELFLCRKQADYTDHNKYLISVTSLSQGRGHQRRLWFDAGWLRRGCKACQSDAQLGRFQRGKDNTEMDVVTASLTSSKSGRLQLRGRGFWVVWSQCLQPVCLQGLRCPWTRCWTLNSPWCCVITA